MRSFAERFSERCFSDVFRALFRGAFPSCFFVCEQSVSSFACSCQVHLRGRLSQVPLTEAFPCCFYARLYPCALSGRPSSVRFFAVGCLRAIWLRKIPCVFRKDFFGALFRRGFSKSLFAEALSERSFLGAFPGRFFAMKSYLRFLLELFPVHPFAWGLFRDLLCKGFSCALLSYNTFPCAFLHGLFPIAPQQNLKPTALSRCLFSCSRPMGVPSVRFLAGVFPRRSFALDFPVFSSAGIFRWARLC